jgi:hypothetical protein
MGLEAQNTFEPVSETKQVDSNCNAIAFKNIGNVNVKVNGLPLNVGDGMLSFVTPRWDVLDRTKYQIQFDRLADNSDYKVAAAIVPNPNDVLFSIVPVLQLSGDYNAVVTLHTALAVNITIQFTVSYTHTYVSHVVYPTLTKSITINAGSTSGTLALALIEGGDSASNVQLSVTNLSPNPAGTKNLIQGTAAEVASGVMIVAPNTAIMVIRTHIKEVN